MLILRRFAVLFAVCGVVAGGVLLSLSIQGSERVDDSPSGNGSREARVTGDPSRRIKVRAPAGTKLFYGMYHPGAADDPDVLAEAIDVGRRVPAIVMWYQAWQSEPLFDVEGAERLVERGIVPMVTWEPWNPLPPGERRDSDQPAYRLERILDGAFDDYIERYAASIRDFGHPVMLRFMHEMNGDWYPWGGLANENSVDQSAAAWRHVHAIFERVGARNVTWVWSPNHNSVPDVEENDLTNYWPGDRYVDWVGVSGFNWGNAVQASVWRGFDEIYQAVYPILADFGKPIAITEISSTDVGGDKASWIRDAFFALAAYPRIDALVWYNNREDSARDWRVTTSPASLQAFRAGVADPQFLEAPAALAAAR